VQFFRDSGSQCRNTGEIAAIFDHEWGHGMDNNGVNPNIANPGEGIADVYSILRLNDSCMGRGFFKGGPCGGYGDPCTVCTGVRDTDWARRASGTPHGIPWIDANCGGGPAPCGGGVHCEGVVVGESGWDLSHRDFRGFGGSVFNFDHHTALELSTRLFYIGSGPVVQWFECTNPNGGCLATGGYMNLLAVDDDNGNLNDGTPHMTAIHAAFNRHNIACATPAPVNSGCAGGPTTAPVLTAVPQDQGVSLSWTAVAGASRYYVYRTEGNGLDFGKIRIGETTGTTFLDTNLQNGRQYFFAVLPVGSNLSCFGVSGTQVQDAPSGFRAFSRDAALRLNVFSKYTYTLETIIQAGQNNMTVISVPVRVNPDLRPSRLVRSISGYVQKSVTTIIRMFVVYRPFRFFMLMGGLVFLAGVGVGARFVYWYFQGRGQGMIQSLILAAVLLMMGYHTMILGFIADLLAVNRRLLEELQLAERKRSLDPGHGSSPGRAGSVPARHEKLAQRDPIS
jgi:hypothetical protein